MKIADVQPTQEFIDDWLNTSAKVRKQVDSKLHMIHRLNSLPRSLNAHRANGGGGLWIGHVNFTGTAHRILFEVNEEGVMVLYRLLTHSEMEEYFLNRKWEKD